MTDQRRKRSQRQEAETAERYGGRTQPGSGSGWLHRNDVRSEEFLIENKRTDNERSITIKADDLRQLRINATRLDKVAIMEIYLGGHNYVILHSDDFAGYIEAGEQ